MENNANNIKWDIGDIEVKISKEKSNLNFAKPWGTVKYTFLAGKLKLNLWQKFIKFLGFEVEEYELVYFCETKE